jgi:hypothetical protein
VGAYSAVPGYDTLIMPVAAARLVESVFAPQRGA